MHSNGLISASVLPQRKKPAFLALPYFAGNTGPRVSRPGRSSLLAPCLALQATLGFEWSELGQGSQVATLGAVARLLMGFCRGQSGRPPPAVLVRVPQGLQKVASGISFSVNLGALGRILAVFPDGLLFVFGMPPRTEHS